MSLTKALQDYWAAAPEIADRLAKAQAQTRATNAALVKDAERYRWLRDKATWAQATMLLNDTPGGIDAAIDTAMSAEPVLGAA